MEFEWDDAKAEANFKKHDVQFAEAVSIWADDNALEIHDPDHSDKEDRWIRLGISSKARMLVVVFVEKISEEKIRVISARKADKPEEKNYFKR